MGKILDVLARGILVAYVVGLVVVLPLVAGGLKALVAEALVLVLAVCFSWAFMRVVFH